MKILQVIHDFLPRHAAGSEIYTYKLAKGLMGRGHEVFLYFTEADRTVPQYTLRKGFFDGIPYYEAVNNRAFSSFEETYNNHAMDGIFKRVLDEVRPDVVHIQHLINHSLSYIRTAKDKGLPVVFTLHDYWLTCPLGGQRVTKDLKICHDLDPMACAGCVSRYSKNSFRLKKIFNKLSARFFPLNGCGLMELEKARVRTSNKDFVRAGSFAINGEQKRALIAHPPSEITYRVSIPESSQLTFSIGMHPDTFHREGEGVRFRVLVDGTEVFSRYINPKEEEKDRRWHEHAVGLGRYHRKIVKLSLVTEPGPGGGHMSCACGWGDVKISPNGGGGGGVPHENLAKKAFLKLSGVLDGMAARKLAPEVTKRLDRVLEASREADLFIAPSEFLRGRFVEFGIPGEKIIHSDYGFDTGAYPRFAKSASGKTRFGYVGTLVPHKGVHVLVEAFNGISDRAELKVYGELAWYPDYVARLQKLKRNPNVHFMGAFDNSRIAEVLSGIDVLVVPSVWFENSPLTIHEAFLSGTPVVASRLGGMAELVRDRIDGLLFEAGNAIDLKDRIEMIVDEPGLLERLKEGVPRVKTIEEDARDMEERYLGLLGTGVSEREWTG